MKLFKIIISMTLGLSLINVIPVSAEDANLLTNSSFETDIYTDQNGWETEVNSWDGLQLPWAPNGVAQVKDGDYAVHFYTETANTFALKQTVHLDAGEYTFKGYFSGEKATPSLSASVDEENVSVSLTGWGAWNQGSKTFTVVTESDVTVKINISTEDGGWGDFDAFSLVKKEVETETDPLPIINGGFEEDIWKDGSPWTVTAATWDKGDSADEVMIKNSTSTVKEGSQSVNYYTPVENTFTVSQKTTLPAGAYTFNGSICGALSSVKLYVDDASDDVKLTGWGVWDEGHVSFTLNEEKEVTVKAVITCSAGGWGYLDDFTITEGEYIEPEDTTRKVQIAPIEGLSEDFIRGVDISSVLSLEEAGVKFYNTKGIEEDLFKILNDAGVNYIRVKVWNDPYDENGKPYGGGTNDVASAKEIGKRAAKYGMKLLVDFHYSDFWASPAVQQRPKAWANLTLEELTEAVYDFTKDSLTEIKAGGADIGMVQVGNETNSKLLDYTDWDTLAGLFNSGLKAVKDFDTNVQTMVHFGGSADGKYLVYLEEMAKRNIKFDILGASWYPFYGHGTLEDTHNRLNTAAKKYGIKVVIAENSYASTFDDSDGHANTFGDDSYLKNIDKCKPWAVSPQGQAQQVRDVIEAVSTLDDGAGIGYFYWEPAWITVGDTTHLTGDAWQKQYDANVIKWKENGCGWASEYAANYYTNKTNVKNWWGGSSWDNQAMFDPTGKAYDSVNVFKYIYTGTNTTDEVTVKTTPTLSYTLQLSDELDSDGIWQKIWKDNIECTMTDDTKQSVDVLRFVETDMNTLINAYTAGKPGTYTIHAILNDEDHTMVTGKVTVKAIPIEDATISFTSVYYAKKVMTPTITIKANGKVVANKITASTPEFAVAYSQGRVKPGKYAVKVIGLGKYTGSKLMFFYIKALPITSTVAALNANSFVYTGKLVTPTVTVKRGTAVFANRMYRANDEFAIAYSKGRVAVGKYAVKIAGKGNINGSKLFYFYIVPRGTAITSVSPVSKGFTLKWAKQAVQTSGYHIQFSTSSKFTNAKSILINSNKTLSHKITKLSGKKRYYVRVRAYKTVGKSRIYSAWSTVKNVTTKS